MRQSVPVFDWAVLVLHFFGATLFGFELSDTQIGAASSCTLHNGAVKSRGQLNYNLRTLLVTVLYTAPLSNIIRLVQHFLSTAQVRGVQ